MIRDITRKQIDAKTAQGERVVLIEARPLAEYEQWHIPFAVQISPGNVRTIAEEFLPNRGSEIVIYGKNEFSPEPDHVAEQLFQLGYRNLYIYRGGKEDWQR